MRTIKNLVTVLINDQNVFIGQDKKHF